MQRVRVQSTWQWLLVIFTLASLVETIFYSQMLAFTPLYLPQLGVSDEGQILLLVDWITAASIGLGIPFLPFKDIDNITLIVATGLIGHLVF